MNIKETFLALTSKTYPYGYEEDLISFLPIGYQIDPDGNYFYKIGESKTIFASHLDTACKDQTPVIHKLDGKLIRTNGKTILGADDKAGVTILLYLIEKKIPGLYYFFIGEEVGCIGSGLAARRKEFFGNYNRIISFDRRGTGSIITFQSGKRCCSDKFADDLARELNRTGMSFSKDTGGVYTDSAEFTGIIPECTNISVGYYKEHTHDEHQDIEHLSKLCIAAAQVDWESLITSRDPSKVEWDDDSYYSWGRSGYYHNAWASSYNQPTRNQQGGKRNSWNNRYDGKKGKGKSYYNDLNTPIYSKRSEPVQENSIGFLSAESLKDGIRERESYFLYLKQIIFDDKLTKDEFLTIQDQYLDLNNPDDLEFSNYIESVL